MKRKIIAVVENHFDQLWRRCFEKDFVSCGKNYVSYSKIEQYYIEENIKLAQLFSDYKFQIENVCAVETYLEHFPDKKEVIKNLYKEGKLKTMNTGYLIVDSNMISIDAIIRNYLLSDKFFAQYVGKTPKVACRSDAFGNSAQLPQVFKQFGATHVREIFYVPYDDVVWIGLDGTAICVKNHKFLGMAGGWSKYAPCPVCNGYGQTDGKICLDCNGRGIYKDGDKTKWAPLYLREDETESGTVQLGGEEFLPRAETLEQIEKLRKEQGVDITLGFEDEMLDLYADVIKKVESGDFEGLKVRKSPEFNPNNTGTLVSRIQTKLGLNEIENKLLALETLNAQEFVKGMQAKNYDWAWKKFMLCAFHDSVTGTMVDPAFAELMEWHKQLNDFAKSEYIVESDGENVCLYNPSSFVRSGLYESKDGRVAFVPKIAPYSFAKVSFEKPPIKINEKPQVKDLPKEAIFTGAEDDTATTVDGERFFIENEYLIIEADDRGLRRITDKRYGIIADILDGNRPAEFLFESDYGSPWATLEVPSSVQHLSERTRFVGIEKGERYTRICYAITLPMQACGVCNSTQIEYTVTLFDGYDKVRFNTKVNWRTFNKRLRVVFPLPIENGRDIYGVPGGWLERQPYTPIYSWSGSNGDWSAYRFGGAESEGKSVALFNRGTPSYRVLPIKGGKALTLSLLRSPAVATYLHEPDAYSMIEYDGMRDEGMHEFSYELACYNAPLAQTDAIKDAENFARRFLSVKDTVDGELPFVERGSATVSHCKIAEDNRGVIVRIIEHSGKDGEVEVFLPSWVKEVYKTDMPETKREPLGFDKTLKISLRGFEILTLYCVKL